MTYDEQCKILGLAGHPTEDLCQWHSTPAIEVLDAPLIGPAVPHGMNPMKLPWFRGGVWSAEIDLDPLAVHFVSAARVLIPDPPDPRRAVQDLPGTWFYGGGLQHHFGHFLTESLGRLWALDLPDLAPIKGIIWVPLFQEPIPAFAVETLAQIQGLPPPMFLTDTVLRPERLVVARQEAGSGFGLLTRPDVALGLRQRFADVTQGQKQDGAVYVSRSGLLNDQPGWATGGTGQLLPGRFLDEAFRQAGYQVCHPQRITVAEQVQTYRNARDLVIDEGSALHLVALVVRPTTRIVVLCRRPWYRFLIEAHLRIYLGEDADISVKMVEGDDMAFANPRARFVVPDMARLSSLLQSAGVPPIMPTRIPEDQVRAAIDHLRVATVSGY